MNKRPSLLLTRRLPDPVEASLRERYEVTSNPEDQPLSQDQLAEAIRIYDAVMPTITDRLDAAVLSAPDARVRIIANYGAGFEHVDLDAAMASGIIVTNTPDVLTDATAELAMLLMLMAARRAGEGERELRRGEWQGWRPTHMIGQSIEGKTLGLVGMGRIAQATARRARNGFNMDIRYYSRSRAADDIEAELGAQRIETLEELFAICDVVSLHVPGGAETRHLVNGDLLRHLRPHAILVNTARGPVIDEAALAKALDDGILGAAGLDVYEREPSVDPLLIAQERAVLLPHLGSATIESRTAMGMRAAANLDAFFAGDEPPDRVA